GVQAHSGQRRHDPHQETHPMTRMLASVLSVVLLACTPASGGQRPLKVFVLAGTSNMHGAAARVEALPEDLRGPIKEALVNQGGEWVPVEGGKNVVGNEATFGKALARHLGEPIGVIRISVGSASERSPGARLSNTVKQAERKGRPIVIAGILLDVSYRDGVKEETANAYRDNLVRWVETTRRELGNPGLPIVMNRAIPPVPRTP